MARTYKYPRTLSSSRLWQLLPRFYQELFDNRVTTHKSYKEKHHMALGRGRTNRIRHTETMLYLLPSPQEPRP
jgi:hypothetical protein